MPNGKSSNASPPAGHNRGQQSSQRGPTPPQSRPDDYSQRNNQSYPPQQMNVQGMHSIYPGMVPNQGQPQRMYYPRAMPRPMRVPHHSQQSNQPMYPSPTSGQQIISIPGGGQGYPIMQQPFVPSQVDYQVPVGSPQMQYRPPPSTMGYGNPQMGFGPTYTPSMAPPMPFVPGGQGQPFMFVRNPQIGQNIGAQPYQPVRHESQQPRKKNIIKIRDPNQDNKDVTEEILSSAAHSSSSSTSDTNVSGPSSSSNTPPISSNSTNEQDNTAATFMKQVAATLHDDKPKSPTTQITKPTIQVAKSTSPKQGNAGIKIISIEKKGTKINDKEKVEIESAKAQPKQTEEAPVVVKTVEKEETEADGASVSILNKEKPETEEEKETAEPKATEPSINNDTSTESDSNITTEQSKVENKLPVEAKQTEIVPNGSISPSEETIKPEETKEVEVTPPEEDLPKSDVNADSSISKPEVETEPEVVEEKTESVESTEEKVSLESAVNGIETEPKTKPAAPASTATEPVKRKKNKRFKDFDKKPESDLMDAYREAPVKQEPVKEEPEEPKEPPKEVSEEKVPSEDETWEDKEEGMWSPEPETEEIKDGPRSYDRDFLLQFQFAPICTAKPEGLPDIEVVLNSINRQPLKQPYQNRMGGGGNDFMPSYMRPAGRPNQSNAPRSNKRAPPKKIVHHTIEQKVELVKTENRWVRPVESEKTLSEEEKKTQETIRKFRGILNKLTPQKFQTLISQVLELDIDTPERLEEIINITFEKAITEPAFSVAYANLCRCLVPTNVKITQDGKEQSLTFRKILLNKCQKEFEREKDDEQSIHKKMEELLQAGLSGEELKVKKAELALEELKGRRRTLGNIRFIGELYKLKMLTESIMHDCIIKLIKSNDEESFECLCKLLTTIGKDLDHPKAKPRMDQYFEQMNKIIVQKKTSSRCRFMLQDVVDLRGNNWVPRRDENNPKTIDQIHKEVAEEEKKTAIAIQQSRQQKRDNPNKGRDSPRPSGVPQADETWTTVPGRTRNVNVDPKKFQDAKKRTNVDTESISLGPGGRGPGAWARGSSGGVGPSAVQGSQNTEQESRGNRFSALGGEGRRGPGASRQGSGAGRQDSRNQGPPGRRPMHDREKALEAVRNVVQTKPRQEDRDTGSPRLEEVEPVKTPTPPPPSVSPPVKQLSDEDIRHKAIGLADEYFGIKDLKEAKYCVEELDPSTHQQLVFHCLNHCLEKHSSERLAIAKMMFYLRKNDIISEENYINGLKQLLEFAEDMEIDIPHVWKYFGELIGPLILDNVLSLKLLSDCIVSLIQNTTKQAKLLAEILLNASKESSPGEVGSIWSKSGLSFSIFFSSNDEAKEFIKDKNLDSIVSSGSHASNVQEELRNLILTKKVSNEDVFKWVDGNVTNPKEPKFIRALVTVVCEGCRKGTPSGSEDSCDVDLFRQRIPLLKKYIDDNSSLELQALFALQALAVQLDQPPDFLKSFFNTLYDEDLISEDAFFTWETNSDPQEAQGKGTALSSTVHFFEWLRSAEEEKNEEG